MAGMTPVHFIVILHEFVPEFFRRELRQDWNTAREKAAGEGKCPSTQREIRLRLHKLCLGMGPFRNEFAASPCARMNVCSDSLASHLHNGTREYRLSRET